MEKLKTQLINDLNNITLDELDAFCSNYQIGNSHKDLLNFLDDLTEQEDVQEVMSELCKFINGKHNYRKLNSPTLNEY